MSTKLKDKTLGFFLTEKMSLAKWDRAGILSREIAPYNLLAKHFKKIYLFTYDGEEELAYKKYLTENIEIVWKKWRMRARDYRWLMALLNWGKIRECDFLKTNQLRARGALMTKIINPKAKLIVRTGWTQSLFEQQKTGRAGQSTVWLEKFSYWLADMALVTSAGDRKYLIEQYKIRPEKIAVIANYIDTDKFAPMNGEKHKRRIVYSGKIAEQKNLGALIKALAKTGVALDIIGGAMDKESEKLQNKLTKSAKEQGVELTFSGRLPNDELPKILNKYKIYVLPSLYEGMPKSLLEAMSAGLACIGTNVSGTKEIIRGGVTGLLSETNADSLKKNILTLVNDEELRAKLSVEARRFVIENFALETQIEKEISIYENLI